MKQKLVVMKQTIFGSNFFKILKRRLSLYKWIIFLKSSNKKMEYRKKNPIDYWKNIGKNYLINDFYDWVFLIDFGVNIFSEFNVFLTSKQNYLCSSKYC